MSKIFSPLPPGFAGSSVTPSSSYHPRPALRSLSLWERVKGLTKARYGISGLKPLALAISVVGLWRVHGERLAPRGFASYEEGAVMDARRILLQAVLRAPRITFDPHFRAAFLRRFNQ